MTSKSGRLVAGAACAVIAVLCAAPASAQPLGDQSPLGTIADGVLSVERPAIATGSGRSLSVWRENAVPSGTQTRGGLSTEWTIAGRFVDGNAKPAGVAFSIGTGGFGRPSRPDVAYNAAREEFLVVWRANVDGTFVLAQRVDRDGALLGDPVFVSGPGSDVTEVARVAWSSGQDRYLVVWDEDYYLDRGLDEDVLGVRLNGADASVIDEDPLFLSSGVSDEDYPDVAYDPVSAKWLTAFTGAGGLYVTTLDVAGAIAGPTGITSGDITHRPAVAANSLEGGFAVVWSRRPETVTRDSFDGDVVALRLDGSGTPVGEQVVVSPADDQASGSSPGIAYHPSANEYLVVWWSHDEGGDPVDQVLGRRLSAALALLTPPEAISVMGVPFTRGIESTNVLAAKQPAVTFDPTTCTYITAFEASARATNVASRAFLGGACKPLNPADSPTRGRETVTTVTQSRTPLPARCVSKRSFRIRLVRRKGRRYRSAVVTVNGKQVRLLTGERLGAPVNLTGLPKGTFRVELRATLTSGRVMRWIRRYKTCRPKLPPSNHLESRNAV